MIRILSIGNSFSQDSHHFLTDVCSSAGVSIYTNNLYIGGCSLERHWELFCSGEEAYPLYEEKVKIGTISLPNALLKEPWDIITFQQASPLSGKPQSYIPYLSNLFSEVKKVCPNAKYYLHKTWPVEQGHWILSSYERRREVMYQCLSDSYEMASRLTGMELIPSADFLQCVYDFAPSFYFWKCGSLSLYRDGRHLSWNYGRFTASLAWAWKLFNIHPLQVDFLPEHPEVVTVPEVVSEIKQTLSEKFSFI